MLGHAPGMAAQRADAAVGIMILYTAQCAERIGGGGCAEHARGQLCVAARVVRMRVAEEERPRRPEPRLEEPLAARSRPMSGSTGRQDGALSDDTWL